MRHLISFFLVFEIVFSNVFASDILIQTENLKKAIEQYTTMVDANNQICLDPSTGAYRKDTIVEMEDGGEWNCNEKAMEIDTFKREIDGSISADAKTQQVECNAKGDEYNNLANDAMDALNHNQCNTGKESDCMKGIGCNLLQSGIGAMLGVGVTRGLQVGISSLTEKYSKLGGDFKNSEGYQEINQCLNLEGHQVSCLESGMKGAIDMVFSTLDGLWTILSGVSSWAGKQIYKASPKEIQAAVDNVQTLMQNTSTAVKSGVKDASKYVYEHMPNWAQDGAKKATQMAQEGWQGMKNFFGITEDIEDASSEKAQEASGWSFHEAMYAVNDPFGWASGKIQDMGSALYESAKKSVQEGYGCARYEGQPYVSKCLEPISDWDCATCAQKMNVMCGVGGYAAGEIAAAFFTGGATAAVKGGAEVSLKVAGKVMSKIKTIAKPFVKIVEGGSSYKLATKVIKTTVTYGSKITEEAALLWGKVYKTKGFKLVSKYTSDLRSRVMEKAGKLNEKVHYIGARANEIAASMASKRIKGAYTLGNAASDIATKNPIALYFNASESAFKLGYNTVESGLQKYTSRALAYTDEVSELSATLSRNRYDPADVADVALLDDVQRMAALKKAYPNLNQKQIDAIMKAHLDIKCPVYACSHSQLKQKLKIMKDAGVPDDIASDAIARGFAGDPYTRAYANGNSDFIAKYKGVGNEQLNNELLSEYRKLDKLFEATGCSLENYRKVPYCKEIMDDRTAVGSYFKHRNEGKSIQTAIKEASPPTTDAGGNTANSGLTPQQADKEFIQIGTDYRNNFASTLDDKMKKIKTLSTQEKLAELNKLKDENIAYYKKLDGMYGKTTKGPDISSVTNSLDRQFKNSDVLIGDEIKSIEQMLKTNTELVESTRDAQKFFKSQSKGMANDSYLNGEAWLKMATEKPPRLNYTDYGNSFKSQKELTDWLEQYKAAAGYEAGIKVPKK